MRQPKIYIKLPSNGRYWPEGSLDVSPTNEYAVYSMTARDEILMKTPDALMNGQATVDVIQSCMPNILDAWQTPSLDLDAILVAIRIATYGEKMDIDLNIPDHDLNYGVDLRNVLDTIYQRVSWDEKIDIGSTMAIYIKPANYLTISKTNLQNFETQKIINLVSDSSLDEEQKILQFRESFKKLTDISVEIINSCVYKIDSSQGLVEDQEFIKEFLENCDKEIFDQIKQRLDQIKTQNTLDPIRIPATPEMIAKGSPDHIEIPLTFDPTTFFA